MSRLARWVLMALGTVLSGAAVVPAQPPPMTAKGCCCVVEGVAYRCTEKTQADCLTLQPKAPVFPKIDDWKKMWNDYVAASEAQARRRSLRLQGEHDALRLQGRMLVAQGRAFALGLHLDGGRLSAVSLVSSSIMERRPDEPAAPGDARGSRASPTVA